MDSANKVFSSPTQGDRCMSQRIQRSTHSSASVAEVCLPLVQAFLRAKAKQLCSLAEHLLTICHLCQKWTHSEMGWTLRGTETGRSIQASEQNTPAELSKAV